MLGWSVELLGALVERPAPVVRMPLGRNSSRTSGWDLPIYVSGIGLCGADSGHDAETQWPGPGAVDAGLPWHACATQRRPHSTHPRAQPWPSVHVDSWRAMESTQCLFSAQAP
jgi:hypothetical protein